MSKDDEQRSVDEIARAFPWSARIALIRKVPEQFGKLRHQSLYSAIAERVYVPDFVADFAYVHWRDDYELATFEEAYDATAVATEDFVRVDRPTLTRALISVPASLRVFRLLLGLTTQEFAAAAASLVGDPLAHKITNGRVKGVEAGSTPAQEEAACYAEAIDRAMNRDLFPTPGGGVRSKIDKPDTAKGWESVQEYAREGVPLAVFLHQRLYGGAFRQLLDATSGQRGAVLEDAVKGLFQEHGIPYIQTGSHNQTEIESRFGLTVKPAPDFLVFDRELTLRGILECKGANDGGTARDKAARFAALRVEANRLGGVPLFAVLAGLGWRRTADALGPVIRDTDGRTFTLPTLAGMLEVQPFPALVDQWQPGM